jgi:hypothetical protein
MARWTCNGGHVIERGLVVVGDAAPDDDPTMTEERWLMTAAARVLLWVEETLRRFPDDRGAVASCRSSVGFARGRLQRAAQVLGSDPRAAMVSDVAIEVQAAERELGDEDAAAAADSLARATHTLNAVLLAATTPAAAEVKRTTTT